MDTKSPLLPGRRTGLILDTRNIGKYPDGTEIFKHYHDSTESEEESELQETLPSSYKLNFTGVPIESDSSDTSQYPLITRKSVNKSTNTLVEDTEEKASVRKHGRKKLSIPKKRSVSSSDSDTPYQEKIYVDKSVITSPVSFSKDNVLASRLGWSRYSASPNSGSRNLESPSTSRSRKLSHITPPNISKSRIGLRSQESVSTLRSGKIYSPSKSSNKEALSRDYDLPETQPVKGKISFNLNTPKTRRENNESNHQSHINAQKHFSPERYHKQFVDESPLTRKKAYNTLSPSKRLKIHTDTDHDYDVPLAEAQLVRDNVSSNLNTSKSRREYKEPIHPGPLSHEYSHRHSSYERYDRHDVHEFVQAVKAINANLQTHQRTSESKSSDSDMPNQEQSSDSDMPNEKQSSDSDRPNQEHGSDSEMSDEEVTTKSVNCHSPRSVLKSKNQRDSQLLRSGSHNTVRDSENEMQTVGGNISLNVNSSYSRRGENDCTYQDHRSLKNVSRNSSLSQRYEEQNYAGVQNDVPNSHSTSRSRRAASITPTNISKSSIGLKSQESDRFLRSGRIYSPSKSLTKKVVENDQDFYTSPSTRRNAYETVSPSKRESAGHKFKKYIRKSGEMGGYDPLINDHSPSALRNSNSDYSHLQTGSPGPKTAFQGSGTINTSRISIARKLHFSSGKSKRETTVNRSQMSERFEMDPTSRSDGEASDHNENVDMDLTQVIGENSNDDLEELKTTNTSSKSRSLRGESWRKSPRKFQEEHTVTDHEQNLAGVQKDAFDISNSKSPKHLRMTESKNLANWQNSPEGIQKGYKDPDTYRDLSATHVGAEKRRTLKSPNTRNQSNNRPRKSVSFVGVDSDSETNDRETNRSNISLNRSKSMNQQVLRNQEVESDSETNDRETNRSLNRSKSMNQQVLRNQEGKFNKSRMSHPSERLVIQQNSEDETDNVQDQCNMPEGPTVSMNSSKYKRKDNSKMSLPSETYVLEEDRDDECSISEAQTIRANRTPNLNSSKPKRSSNSKRSLSSEPFIVHKDNLGTMHDEYNRSETQNKRSNQSSNLNSPTSGRRSSKVNYQTNQSKISDSPYKRNGKENEQIDDANSSRKQRAKANESLNLDCSMSERGLADPSVLSTSRRTRKTRSGTGVHSENLDEIINMEDGVSQVPGSIIHNASPKIHESMGRKTRCDADGNNDLPSRRHSKSPNGKTDSEQSDTRAVTPSEQDTNRHLPKKRGKKKKGNKEELLPTRKRPLRHCIGKTPLKYWEGQRRLYQYSKTDIIYVGLEEKPPSPVRPQKTTKATKMPRKKNEGVQTTPGVKKQKTAKDILSKPEQLCIIDPETKKRRNLVTTFQNVEWEVQPSYKLARTEFCNDNAYGYIQLDENGKKEAQQSPKTDIRFVVLEGLVEFKVEDVIVTVGRRDTFLVPKGYLYSIKNSYDDISLLHFSSVVVQKQD